MMWFVYALTFAVITSISVLLSKSVMKEVNEYLFLWLNCIFVTPVLLLIVLYFYGIPKFDLDFIIYILIFGGINYFAAILAYRAIRIAEVSLVSPISAFNPIFTSFIAWITLGESFGVKGMMGIFLICVGAYLLQLSKVERGWYKPLQSLFTNRAVRLSLASYFLWSVTPIFQKLAIEHTYPRGAVFTSLVGTLAFFLALSFAFSKFEQNPLAAVMRYFKQFLALGVIGGVGGAVSFLAISLGNLGFVTAVFKLSMLFSVILGWVIFKEHDFRERILGSTVMLGGLILLSIK